MKKWIIVYETYNTAVKKVFAAVSEYITVSCVKLSDVSTEDLNFQNLIYVGKNPYIEAPKGGHRIKAFKENERQIIVITGDGDVNTLYGAVDFKNKYLVKAKNADIHQPVYYFYKLFVDDMPDYDESFIADTKNRALWTWGYVIYDYKGYIDNMVNLKLNMLIIWNDCVPVNAKELVDYAHKNGVKVVWGFSWGWGLNCVETDVTRLDKITEEVLATYERDYAPIGGDGIYFQTFTETSEEKIGDVLIADAAVRLVNDTSEKLLMKYPGLYIQFGLHATSVKNKLEFIKNVIPEVSIIWEDCGAFPYRYMAKNINDYDKTLGFTKEIKNLRDGGFGVILKGMTALDWSTFVHQPGPFVIGEYEPGFVDKKAEEKRPIWKYIQSYWIKNAEYAKRMIDLYDENTTVGALVEDGCFEKYAWYPVALYAEMLWDKSRDVKDILCDTGLMPDVYFA